MYVKFKMINQLIYMIVSHLYDTGCFFVFCFDKVLIKKKNDMVIKYLKLHHN